MSIHKEQLNGGLVQTRHSTLLRDGELQQADDCILRPGDPAIHKAPGRTAFGTVRSTAVTCTASAGSPTLTSSSAFGSNFTVTALVAGNTVITSAALFGSVAVGQSVWGTGIPIGTYVRRVIDTSNIEITLNITASGATTITISDFHPGTYITGANITTGTYIISITNASSLTMSANALTGAGSASRTFSERIQGIRSLFFDGAVDDLLLVKAADKLYTAPATAITGTFTSRLVGLSHDADAILETVHFKDRHVILTGFNNPRVLYYKDDGTSTTQVPTIRTFGMQPVADFIGPALLDPGSWSSLEDFQNGWYYFLVVEVTIFGKDDEVEGTYTGDPKSVYMSDYTTKGISVAYLNSGARPVNDGLYGRNLATHWRVYMSPRFDNELPVPDLSTFRRVAEVPFTLDATGALTANATVDLKDLNPFQSGWAAVLAANGSDDALFPSGTTNVLSQVAAQTQTATTVANSNILTSSAAFGTVVPGMVIISTNNRIPYGTVVKSKESSSSLTMSENATIAGSETVGFSNKDSFDNLFATCPRNTGVVRRGGKFQNFGFQNIGGFSTGVVTGVKVEIKGRFVTNGVDDPGFLVAVSRDGTTFSADRTGKFKTTRTISSLSQGEGVIELGGQFDTWGVAWIPSDFINGAAKVNVRLRKGFGINDTQNSHAIDGVKITVYCGGNSINLDGDPFPTIIVSDQLGNSFGSPAAGPPPVASTGDVFDGMLILNDTAAESDIVASLPDDEEMFPDTYRLHLNKNARIRVIKHVANGLVVLCQESIKRLTYFPTEENATSAQGRCYEEIASDHGVVGSRAAVLLDLPGRGAVCAYMSHKGLMWTDGVTTVPMNEDIDWTGGVTGTPLIEPTLIQQTVLEVYPRLSLLCIQYVPNGGTRKTKALWLSYHPTHVKEGFRLPAVGPVSMNGESACNSLISGKSYFFSGNSLDGKVYVEDSGTSDDSGLDSILPIIRTRRFFCADLGWEGRVERVFLIAGVVGTSTTGAFTVAFIGQDHSDPGSTRGSDTGSTDTNGLIKLHLDHEAELFDLTVSKSAAQSAAFRLHYFGFEVTPMSQDTT